MIWMKLSEQYLYLIFCCHEGYDREVNVKWPQGRYVTRFQLEQNVKGDILRKVR